MNVTNSVSSAIRSDICVTFEPATPASSHLQISVKSFGCRERILEKVKLEDYGIGKMSVHMFDDFPYIRTLRVLEWNGQISEFTADKVECRAAISTLKSGCRVALFNIYYKTPCRIYIERETSLKTVFSWLYFCSPLHQLSAYFARQKKTSENSKELITLFHCLWS